jgi:hypothetical protein
MPITGGIGTGLATRTIWEIGARTWTNVFGWRYRRVFGKDAFQGNTHLAYGLLEPPPVIGAHGNKVPHIFTKPSKAHLRFSISKVASICEVRGLTYLAESIASNTRTWVKLTSDEDIGAKCDLSYISLGIMNNDKTTDLLRNDGNLFVNFPVDWFITKLSGRTIVTPSTDAKIDYGMIIKIHPTSAPERIWMCCGGYGEWGTSAAAWYLARRWRDIHKRFGNKPFVIFVQVEPGRDESATEIISAATPQELERQAGGYLTNRRTGSDSS